MIASMVVVIDEPANAGLKIARLVIVLQQDAVLERLKPAIASRRTNASARQPGSPMASKGYPHDDQTAVV